MRRATRTSPIGPASLWSRLFGRTGTRRSADRGNPQPFHRELPAVSALSGSSDGSHSHSPCPAFTARTKRIPSRQTPFIRQAAGGLDSGRGTARARPGPGEATMALPRVLVVRGSSLTAGADPIADREWYAWRLIGRNNRELGRSASIHPDVAACRADVIRLQAAAPRLSKFVVADLDQGLWRWRLESSGEVRADTARTSPEDSSR